MDELTTKILFLSDLQEQYLMALKIDSNHKFKQMVNKAIKSNRNLVKLADKHLGPKADEFGYHADNLKIKIDKLFLQL